MKQELAFLKNLQTYIKELSNLIYGSLNVDLDIKHSDTFVLSYKEIKPTLYFDPNKTDNKVIKHDLTPLFFVKHKSFTHSSILTEPSKPLEILKQFEQSPFYAHLYTSTIFYILILSKANLDCFDALSIEIDKDLFKKGIKEIININHKVYNPQCYFNEFVSYGILFLKSSRKLFSEEELLDFEYDVLSFEPSLIRLNESFQNYAFSKKEILFKLLTTLPITRFLSTPAYLREQESSFANMSFLHKLTMFIGDTSVKETIIQENINNQINAELILNGALDLKKIINDPSFLNNFDGINKFDKSHIEKDLLSFETSLLPESKNEFMLSKINNKSFMNNLDYFIDYLSLSVKINKQNMLKEEHHIQRKKI